MTKEILVTYIDPDGPDHGTSSWLDTFDGLQMTESNSVVSVPVPGEVYRALKCRLEAAGYGHAIADGQIYMSGIALTDEDDEDE